MYISEDWSSGDGSAMKTDAGRKFNYCSGCSHVLSAIVQEASGETTVSFAEKYLFKHWELRTRGGRQIGMESPLAVGLNLRSRYGQMATCICIMAHGWQAGGQQQLVQNRTNPSYENQSEPGYGTSVDLPTHGAYSHPESTVKQFSLPRPNLIVVTQR